jgi:Na+/phosphate symporter
MSSTTIFASILAGLGLIFIGIKLVAASLGLLAGRGLRQLVAHSTGSYPASALIGLFAGGLTQSTNAITVILMSLFTADLITLNQAAPIMAWANVGTSALVLAVAINIHLFVLAITAVGYQVKVRYDADVKEQDPRRLQFPTRAAVLVVAIWLLDPGQVGPGWRNSLNYWRTQQDSNL